MFNTLYKSIFAGVLIGMAAIISVRARYPYVMFAIGLIAVICCGAMLYTGLIGKTPLKDYKTILLVLLGNFTGTALMCLYVIFLGDPSLFDNFIVAKESYSLIYVLISSVFCGILMCVATVLNKDKNIFIMILCVAAFILGRFPHCIADAFYLSLNGVAVYDILYLLCAIVGNTFGAKLAYLCFRRTVL